jgi:hypothetical protein
MESYKLPEAMRRGITWRRIKNLIKEPKLVAKNFFLWVNRKKSKDKHIFVVGPERSGTVLLKNVIRSNPYVCSVDGETAFFLRRRYDNLDQNFVDNEKYEEIFKSSYSVTEIFDRLARGVKDREEAKIFLEKTPAHAQRANYIIDQFPFSYIVFIIRDPRDALRSAKKHKDYWVSLNKEDRVGSYIESWKQSVNSYFEVKENNRVLAVKYEDFCRSPKKELQRLGEGLEINVYSRQLNPDSYGDTSVARRDAHSRLREPITDDSVGLWKQDLPPTEVERVEEYLSEEMEKLGYSSSMK